MHYASERTARKKFLVAWDFSEYFSWGYESRFFLCQLKSLSKGETIFSLLSPRKSRAAEKIVSPLERDPILWHRKNIWLGRWGVAAQCRSEVGRKDIVYYPAPERSWAARKIFSMHYASERTARKKFLAAQDFLQRGGMYFEWEVLIWETPIYFKIDFDGVMRWVGWWFW